MNDTWRESPCLLAPTGLRAYSSRPTYHLRKSHEWRPTNSPRHRARPDAAREIRIRPGPLQPFARFYREQPPLGPWTFIGKVLGSVLLRLRPCVNCRPWSCHRLLRKHIRTCRDSTRRRALVGWPGKIEPVSEFRVRWLVHSGFRQRVRDRRHLLRHSPQPCRDLSAPAPTIGSIYFGA